MKLQLKDTVDGMLSADYSDRFIAEYFQLKIRYEKLKTILNRWDAYNDYKYHNDVCINTLEDFLGFKPSCSYDILREQQRAMGELLHLLEVRAVIEHISLDESFLIEKKNIDRIDTHD